MTKNRRGDATFDLIILLLALWLMTAPRTFGFLSELPASLSAWISGVTVAVLGVAGLLAVVERGLNIIVGFWIAISPWVIGFATDAFAMWNHFLVGLAVWGLEAVRLLRPSARGTVSRKRRGPRRSIVRTGSCPRPESNMTVESTRKGFN